MVEDKVLTICFHMDECKISHESTPVVDNTISWLKEDCKVLFEDGLGAMKVRQGKTHDYIGMTLDYSHGREVHNSLVKYTEDVWDTFQEAQVEFDNGFVEVRRRSKSQMTAAPTNLFVVNKECESLK